jgi:eukaryotic translation initiation factor 2C
MKYPGALGILVSNREKPIIFPAEVCTIISGQMYKKQVPQDMTPKVVKFASNRPQERLDTIIGRDRKEIPPVGRTSNTMSHILTPV